MDSEDNALLVLKEEEPDVESKPVTEVESIVATNTNVSAIFYNNFIHSRDFERIDVGTCIL